MLGRGNGVNSRRHLRKPRAAAHTEPDFVNCRIAVSSLCTSLVEIHDMVLSLRLPEEEGIVHLRAPAGAFEDLDGWTPDHGRSQSYEVTRRSAYHESFKFIQKKF